MRTRNDYPGALGGTGYLEQHDLEPLADAVTFRPYLLGGGQYRFGPAEVDEYLTRFKTLYDAGYYFAFLIGEFFEYSAVFRFVETL